MSATLTFLHSFPSVSAELLNKFIVAKSTRMAKNNLVRLLVLVVPDYVAEAACAQAITMLQKMQSKVADEGKKEEDV